MRAATTRTYRFPLNDAIGGAAELETAQGYAVTAGQAIAAWFAGPWTIDSWVGIAVLAGGAAFQIGFVYWFSSSRPRGPEDIHGVYAFLAWMLMAFMLAAQAAPYLLFLEPLIGRFIGASVPPIAGRKPLLIVLNTVAATVILLGAVMPSVDGNYADHMPYLYIAAETSFLTGWLFGLTYCVVMAMSIREYSLAHLGLTPALAGVMFMFAGLAGAALVKDWMIRCNTGEVGGGPWDGCTGAMATDGIGMGGGTNGASGGTSSGGTSPSGGCPCPNAAGTKCNCPFDNNCNVQSACYNPSGGRIPGGCKMGCMG